VNDTEADPVSLPGENAATVRVLPFDELDKGYNDVEIHVLGDRVPFQVFTEYTLMEMAGYAQTE
jgi:hypothetical protein